MAVLAPSLLAADKSRLDEEIALSASSGALFLHLDIMDGEFVPNVSFGPDVVGLAKALHPGVNDVHLMVVRPEEKFPLYAEEGADIMTFHYEALDDDSSRFAAIKQIHDLGKKAGMSVKPNTPVEVLEPFLKDLDLVLVMSVEPGKGGQSFLPSALGKLQYLKEQKQRHGYSYWIEVDGGINLETGKMCVEAGAEVLVAGSYLFGHEDFLARAKGLIDL